MGLFSKTEKIEAVLPFKLVPPTAEDKEACTIELEAYGFVGNCTRNYYFASFDLAPDLYDELVDALSKFTGDIKIIVTVKDDVPKKFKIDFKDLAKKLQNEKFAKCSIVGYGIGDDSCLDLM